MAMKKGEEIKKLNIDSYIFSFKNVNLLLLRKAIGLDLPRHLHPGSDKAHYYLSIAWHKYVSKPNPIKKYRNWAF